MEKYTCMKEGHRIMLRYDTEVSETYYECCVCKRTFISSTTDVGYCGGGSDCIMNLDIPNMAKGGIRGAGICKISTLANNDELDLLKMVNIGRKSADRILVAMSEKGFKMKKYKRPW
jgi:DNA-directed RNA polymerase alpha subunit